MESWYEQNNSEWYFSIDFLQDQGWLSQSHGDIIFNTTWGTVSLSGQQNLSSGFIVSSPINPVSFQSGWNIEFDIAQLANPDDIKIDILDCNSWTVIPGYSWLSLTANHVDISAIDPSAFACIYAKVKLFKHEEISPLINAIKITRTPLAQYLSILQAPDTINADEPFMVNLQYSLSYVDDIWAVAYISLPQKSQATITGYTTWYQQDLNPIFISAEQNGIYTSQEITLHNVTIPAHSVYWDLGNISAWSNGNLKFLAKIPRFTESWVAYTFQAFIDWDHAQLNSSNSYTSITHSHPNPSLYNNTDTFLLNGENVFFPTIYIPWINYSISSYNLAPANEAIFSPILTADLSGVFSLLESPVCHSLDSSLVPGRISDISNSGILDITGQKITWTWNIQNWEENYSYHIDYSWCDVDGTFITIVYTLDAINISPLSQLSQVKISTDFSPELQLSKDVSHSHIYNKQATDFTIHLRNISLPRVENIVIFDKFSTGLSLINPVSSIVNNVDYAVFYHTWFQDNNYNNPPAYNYLSALSWDFGTWWTSVFPSSGTHRAGIFVQCLNSEYLQATWSCLDKAYQISATLQTRGSLDNQCSAENKTNSAYAVIYSGSTSPVNGDDTIETIVPSYTLSASKTLSILPKIGLRWTISLAWSHIRNVGETASVSISDTNIWWEIISSWKLIISAPQVDINWIKEYLNMNASSNGWSIHYDLSHGKIIIDYGNIAINQTIYATVNFDIPPGVDANKNYNLLVQTSWFDQNCWTTLGQSSTYNFSFAGNHQLKLTEQRNLGYILPDGNIIYHLNALNDGDFVTKNTYVISQIPSQWKFVEAYLTGQDDDGFGYSCSHCKMLFANDNPQLPETLSISDPFILDDMSLFADGIFSGWVWLSPYGSWTKYLAYKLDNSLGIVPQWQTFLMWYKIQDNHSTQWEVIINNSAILSQNVLQSISNSVQSTILSSPWLDLSIHISPQTLPAWENFTVTIPYYNNADSIDNELTLYVTLPGNVSLSWVEHLWNYTTIAHWWTGLVQDITHSSIVNTWTNVWVSGSRISFDASVLRKNELWGEWIYKLEWWTLTLFLHSNDTLVSNSTLPFQVDGLARNMVTEINRKANTILTISNPDLSLWKTVDLAEAIQWEIPLYTIELKNMWWYQASWVYVQDILDTWLCYINGSTSPLTNHRNISEPLIIWNCSWQQTLIRSGIIKDGSHTGYLESQDAVKWTYNARILNSVANGSSLYNFIEAFTPLKEDSGYPNTANRRVYIPNADPYVDMSVNTVVYPGESFSYRIIYGNTTRPTSTGVSIIHKIPTYNSGKTVILNNIVKNFSEEVFYHSWDQMVAFNFDNPTQSGRTTILTPQSKRIAFKIWDLWPRVGPREIIINAEAKDAVNQELIPPGTAVTFQSQIFSSPVDENSWNNISYASSHAPWLDLSLDIFANHEWSYPGVVPWTDMHYTVNFENQWDELSCANKIGLHLDPHLVLDTDFHNFDQLQLLDTHQNPIKAIHKDWTPISQNIHIFVDPSNAPLYIFYLWEDAVTYQDVCLPWHSKQSFQIYWTIDQQTPNETPLVLSGYITEDWDEWIEYITGNNSAISSVTTYLADVFVDVKPDPVNTQTAIAWAVSNFTIEYGNNGLIAAKNVFLQTDIPAGTCFAWLSSPSQIGFTLQYSIDGIHRDYNPLGWIDCKVVATRAVRDQDMWELWTSIGENTTNKFLWETHWLTVQSEDAPHGLTLATDNSTYTNIQSSTLITQYLENVTTLKVGNMNNDALKDIALLWWRRSGPSTYGITVYNILSGGTVQWIRWKLDYNINTMTLWDIDNNGNDDILFWYSNSSSIKWFEIWWSILGNIQQKYSDTGRYDISLLKTQDIDKDWHQEIIVWWTWNTWITAGIKVYRVTNNQLHLLYTWELPHEPLVAHIARMSSNAPLQLYVNINNWFAIYDIASDYSIHWDQDINMSSWPYDFITVTALMVSDINHDNIKEIIVWYVDHFHSQRGFQSTSTKYVVYDENITPLYYKTLDWTTLWTFNNYVSLSLWDPNQDDKQELIVSSTLHNAKIDVQSFNLDRTPINIYNNTTDWDVIWTTFLTDLDDNGEMEILVWGHDNDLPYPYGWVRSYEFKKSVVEEKYHHDSDWIERLTTYDLNGDGINTIIAHDYWANNTQWLSLYNIQTGSLILTTAITWDNYWFPELAVGMLDTDSIPDIVAVWEWNDAGKTKHGFYIYESTGEQIEQQIVYTGNWTQTPDALALIDINNDNHQEIFVWWWQDVRGSNGVAVYSYSGGQITPIAEISWWNDVESIASLGDLTHDGNVEFLVWGDAPGGAMKLYTFSGGEIHKLYDFAGLSYAYTLTIWTYAQSNQNYIMVWWANWNNTKTWGTKVYTIDDWLNINEIFSQWNANDWSEEIAWWDVNNNGHPDMIIAWYFYDDATNNAIGNGFEIYELSGWLFSLLWDNYNWNDSYTITMAKIDDYPTKSLIVGGEESDWDTLKIYQNTSKTLLTSWSYLVNISSVGNLNMWNKLYLNQTIEDNTDILYHIYASNGWICDTHTILKDIGSPTSDVIDISDIPNTLGDICLWAQFIWDSVHSPMLHSRYVNYISDYTPYLELALWIQEGWYLWPVFNIISDISTTTVQSNYNNDRSVYHLPLLASDLSVIKHVDTVAVTSGDIARYTLEYYNRGPYPAENVVITDSPDTHILYAGPHSRSLWDVAVWVRGTISFTWVIASGVVPGDIVRNGAVISTNTYDPVLYNNTDAVQSIVWWYANVNTTIDCIDSAYIDQTFDCSIHYFNNGNVVASGMIITGVMDDNVELISLTGNHCTIFTWARPHYFVCDNFDLINNSWSLITSQVKVDNNSNLLSNNVILKFSSTVSTQTTETNIGDNYAEDLVPIKQQNSSVLQGKVFLDLNKNEQYDTSEDDTFSWANIFIWGEDSIHHTLLLPDQNIYPLAYEKLRQSLGLTEPFSYVRIPPVVSQDNWEYFIVGLDPGNYALFVTWARGYVKETSLAGEVNWIPSGQWRVDNQHIDWDQIVSISIPFLPDGSFARDYLFSLQWDCGDGQTQLGEFCDDWTDNWNPWMCNYFCSALMPLCGNSLVEAWESCDDGNTMNEDGCSATCQIEHPNTWWWGYWWWQDICPDNRDCSDSYYDNLCGKCDDDGHSSASICSIVGSTWNNEVNDAYQFACHQWITTINTIVPANPDGHLIRMEMAKMVTIFMVKVLWVTTYYDDPRCKQFDDLEGISQEMKFYIEKACGLRVMWMQADGKNPMQSFMPYDTVDRAQFGTVLSRILFDGMYNIKNPTAESCRYCDHLQALQKNKIMHYINDPWMTELRSFVWIMMQRVKILEGKWWSPEYWSLGIQER